VNAAFLLVTTAWFAGADANPTKPPEKIKNPPVTNTAPLATGGSCGGGDCGGDCGCDACDECGHGLRHKLRGLFRRHNDCDCGCETSCCAPAPAPSCGCDTCDTGCGRHSLLSKLRGRFHRHGDCCDTCGCDGAGVTGVITTAPQKIENMPKTSEPPAQKMPNGNEKVLKLESVPNTVPNVTVETEKSPF
jgi:hypothetical protein